MQSGQPAKRFLGITVLGDFILSEGVENVLEKLQRAGATAVACNPTVSAPAEEGAGSFQPPVDAGSSPRVFDRPLFGKRSLWVRSGPSYQPNPDFYGDSPYGPRKANELTGEYGAVIGRFIDGALGRGLKVYFQIGAVQPSGLRDEDRPRVPTGELSQQRMADTGSLASDAIRAYNRAYVGDLLAAYPGITGFRVDWPEYPCYTLDETFHDFSPHVEAWAGRHGFDFPRIRDQVRDFYHYLQGQLTSGDLEDLAVGDRGQFSLVTLFNRHPGVADWLRLKAALSTDLVRDWRDIVSELGGPDKELCANAFMPPYSLVTGLDFQGVAKFSDAVSPKLYTMHWSLMVKFWGDVLLAKNPRLDERILVRALVNLMDIADPGEGGETIAEYGYPHPDEPHPIPNKPQLRKIKQARHAAGNETLLLPLAHGYGPLEDFRRRFKLVADSDVDGVWINRYGYLSDEKLDAIAEIWHET